MSTLVIKSKSQLLINEQSTASVPVDLTQFGLAASQTVGLVSATFSIPPGSQALALPSWVPTSSDFIAFKAAGEVTDISDANSVNLIADATSSNVQLFTSGTPTTVVVSNPGNIPAWIALGASNAVAAVVGSGTLVAPGKSVSLALASNSYLAGITASGSALLQAVVGS